MRFASRMFALAAATAVLTLPMLGVGAASASRAIAPCDPPAHAMTYQLLQINLPLLAPENMGSVGPGGVQNIC
jgi:hypothetical protein